MRTTYSKIKYALKGMLLSDEPLLEAVIIVAPAKDITSVASRMGMKVWIKQGILLNPEEASGIKVWWVGVKTLPYDWRQPS